MTLHALSDRFQQPVPLQQAGRADSTLFGSTSPEEISRPLLWQEHSLQYSETDKYIRVCPLCLDEPEGYDRLYWRCKLLYTCPRHRIYLVATCPGCQERIPALRPSAATCPTCRKGDYRSAPLTVLPEEDWLLESQLILLHRLGIDDEELGGYQPTHEVSLLETLHSWDYLSLLANSLRALQQLIGRAEVELSYLVRSLALEATLGRLGHHLRRMPVYVCPPMLIHYLSSAWPSDFPIFLELIQQMLEEAYHYQPESELVERWSKILVQGNFWCHSSYQQRPVSHMQALLTTFSAYFLRLPRAETVVSSGSNTAHARIERPTEITSRQEEMVLPFRNESLPSLLTRVGQRRGDAFRTWLLHAFQDEEEGFWFDAGDLLLLEQQQKYDFLETALSLDAQALYALTLHSFSLVLQPPGLPDHSFWKSIGEETIAQPLLSEETVARHCLPRGTTRLCPACLEEHDPYERLFWNLRAVLICPSHQIWLIDRCLSCQRRIPSLRSNVSRCPSCRQGYYRAAQHISVSQDSILSHSQWLLLHKLDIPELYYLDGSSLFFSSPLTGLLPWEYVDLLECFSRVAPPLRPERTFALLCQCLGFPEEPFA